MGDPRRKEKKEAKKEKKRLKRMGAPPLNKPEDPAFIDDRTQEEYTNKEHMNAFGTDVVKYKQAVIDNDLSGKSNNKRRREANKKRNEARKKYNKRTRIKKH